jgi:ABC-type phosphate transport system substrate-binding protein
LKRRLVVLLLLMLALTPAPRPVIAGEGENYVVIVNASNDVSEVSQDLLARIFLRKVRTWRGGRAAAPVDHSLASPLRSAFSRKVLGLSISEVRDFWMKQTLSGGDVAPPVRSSERDVVDFVKGEPGGIGYVSADSALPSDVKAVKVTQ